MLYPVFLKLAGKRVLLVGGGTVAAAKLEGLLAAGALVTVVAPDINPAFERHGVTLHRRNFTAADLDGAWWVVAAAPPDVNRQVQIAAESRQLFVNAVDDPAHATAYLGGVERAPSPRTMDRPGVEAGRVPRSEPGGGKAMRRATGRAVAGWCATFSSRARGPSWSSVTCASRSMAGIRSSATST